MRDVNLHGINTPADMWVQIRQLVEQADFRAQIHLVILGRIRSGLAPLFGPDHDASQAEFTLFQPCF